MARRSVDIWRGLVRRWQKSGLSAAAFAAEVGVAPRTLVWWRWRLRNGEHGASAKRTSRERRPEGHPSPRDASVGLVRVVAAGPATVAAPGPAVAETAVELVFGDVLVRVRRGFDAATLGRVIDVLEGEETRGC